MTREEHLMEYESHRRKANSALHSANSQSPFNFTLFNEYRSEIKLANKHYGIASAMWTKKMRKEFGYNA